MKSVIQSDYECYLCGNVLRLQVHHLLHGFANRSKADRRGLWVYLCPECHNNVHLNNELDLKLKKIAQRHYERHCGSRREFIQEFGKSYL